MLKTVTTMNYPKPIMEKQDGHVNAWMVCGECKKHAWYIYENLGVLHFKCRGCGLHAGIVGSIL